MCFTSVDSCHDSCCFWKLQNMISVILPWWLALLTSSSFMLASSAISVDIVFFCFFFARLVINCALWKGWRYRSSTKLDVQHNSCTSSPFCWTDGITEIVPGQITSNHSFLQCWLKVWNLATVDSRCYTGYSWCFLCPVMWLSGSQCWSQCWSQCCW